MSTLVDDLLTGITSRETPTWGIPVEQVAVTRVTIDDEDVLAAQGALSWKNVRQYVRQNASELDMGTNVLFYFSVSVDTSVPPPDPLELLPTYFRGTLSVDRVYGGERVHGWLRTACTCCTLMVRTVGSRLRARVVGPSGLLAAAASFHLHPCMVRLPNRSVHTCHACFLCSYHNCWQQSVPCAAPFASSRPPSRRTPQPAKPATNSPQPTEPAIATASRIYLRCMVHHRVLHTCLGHVGLG